MPMKFSERLGFNKPRTEIQHSEMDDALRNGLWNGVTAEILTPFKKKYHLRENYYLDVYFKRLWADNYKKPIDTLESVAISAIKVLRSIFFKSPWEEVYDFIEFTVQQFPQESAQNRFKDYCNRLLARELSPYRFVDDTLVEITEEEQVIAVERAIEDTSIIKTVRMHLKSAVNLFADRENPDYRNSMKESISAVEALLQAVVGDDSVTLGKAVNRLESEGIIELHESLRESIKKLYSYTSDADGIRHSLKDMSKVDLEDARFMLITCSAFVSYVLEKVAKAGISLKSR